MDCCAVLGSLPLQHCMQQEGLGRAACCLAAYCLHLHLCISRRGSSLPQHGPPCAAGEALVGCLQQQHPISTMSIQPEATLEGAAT